MAREIASGYHSPDWTPKGQTMLRALSLVVFTLTFPMPSQASEPNDHTVVAQEKPAAPIPQRDCEKKAEGIS